MTKADLEKERNYLVVKSNRLVQDTMYTLTALEYKVLMRCFQKIRPDQTKLEPIEFEIREFCHICGMKADSGKNYENVRDAVMNLKSRSVWIQKLDENMQPMVDKKGKPHLETFSWVSKAEMKTGEGTITIILDSALEKYLINLESFKIAVLQAYGVYPMKSKYGGRLYELLRSYHNMKAKFFTLAEISEKTGSNYKDWGAMHQRVIKPAIAEINKFTELQVTYKQKKRGKTCQGLTFDIKKKDELNEEITKRYVQQMLDGYEV